MPTVSQKVIFVIQFCENLADLLSGIRKRCFLYLGKRQTDHRICPLHLPVLFLLPDGQPFEQIPSACMIRRKEILQHAHVQRLTEAPRAGNQRYIVPVLPPFLNKSRFVHIKAFILYHCPKVLFPNAHCPRHAVPSHPTFPSDIPVYKEMIAHFPVSVYCNLPGVCVKYSLALAAMPGSSYVIQSKASLLQDFQQPLKFLRHRRVKFHIFTVCRVEKADGFRVEHLPIYGHPTDFCPFAFTV